MAALTANDAPAKAADVPQEEDPAPSLTASFSWTLAGNVVYAACQWAVLMALAKLGSPEMVGQFSLGLAVTAPVILLSGLQLRTVQATDVRGQFQFGDYLGLRLLLTASAVVAIGVIIFVTGYRAQTALVVLGVAVGKAFESVGDVFCGLFQQKERMERVARALMLQGILALAAMGGGLALTGSLAWATVGWAAAAAVTLGAYTAPSAIRLFAPRGGVRGYRTWPQLAPQFCAATLWRLTWLALPLGLVMMLLSLNSNLPRYFIEDHEGDGPLGIYSALAYLMVAGNTVVAALGQSACARLARHYDAGDRREFCRLLAGLVGVGLGVGLAGVGVALVAGTEVLTWVYTAEYAGHQRLLVWLMAAAALGFVGSFLGYGLTAARVFRAQLPLFAATAVVTAGACAALVPRYGLLGGAWATAAGTGFQVIGSAALLRLAVARIRR